MEKNEIIKAENQYDKNQIEKTIDLAHQLPKLMKEQFDDLEEVETHVREALEIAQEMNEAAGSNNRKKAKLLGGNKSAIKQLQEIVEGITEAQISAAEAQKLQFEYQQKLSQITTALFGFGLMSIAANRTVVREIHLRLKNASEEEISDLARQELIGVVKQLESQADILQKQETLGKKLEIQKGVLKEQGEAIGNIHIELEQKSAVDEEQDYALKKQEQKGIEHDRLFEEKAQKDLEQDQTLALQIEKDKEHDRLLENYYTRLNNLDTELLKIQEKSRQLDEDFAFQFEINKDFKDQFENQLDINGSVAEDIKAVKAEIESVKNQIQKIITDSAKKDEIIASLESRISELEKSVQKKLSMTVGIISGIITIAAFIMSVLHFFI